MRFANVLTVLSTVLLLVCITGNPSKAQGPPARDFDSTIRAEVAAIAKAWSIAPRIEFRDSNELEARPDGIIVVGRTFLRSLLNGVSTSIQSDALRWLLAHELWHLVQFQTIGADLFNRPDAFRRVIECQADLMAGHFLFNSLASGFREKTDALRTVGDLPSSVALLTHGGATHPPEADRRVSIQFGMSRAFYDHAERIVGPEQADNVRQNVSALLNFSLGEAVDVWGLGQCKKITHYDQSSVFLERAKTDVSWNKNGKPPVVTFNITYRNGGNKPLRVSLEVLSASIPREAPSERARWQRQQALHQTVEIEPRMTHTVSGTLYWYADEKLMPRLIYPLDEGSLVSVEEIDRPVTRKETVLAQADGLNAETAKFGTALLRISNDAPNNFRNLRAPGCWGDTDMRYCPSSVTVPGALRTEVWVEKNGSATVEIDFRSDVAKDEAQAVYEKLVRDFKALWPMRIQEMKEKVARNSGLPYLEFALTDRADISLDFRGKDGNYHVSATITPVN
jgi:hypothetical protein